MEGKKVASLRKNYFTTEEQNLKVEVLIGFWQMPCLCKNAFF